jgi:hypothetical protein
MLQVMAADVHVTSTDTPEGPDDEEWIVCPDLNHM